MEPVRTNGQQRREAVQQRRVVGEEGFEPPVSCSQSRRPDQAGLHPDSVLAAAICFQDLHMLSTVELTIN